MIVRHLRAIRIIHLVGVFFASVSLMQAAPSQPAETLINGVKVKLQLSETDIVVGQPIYLQIVVTNVSAPLRVGTILAKFYFSESNDINVTVQRPGELPARFEAAEQPMVKTAQELNLNNGEFQHQDFTILYDKSQPDGYLFNKPGDYLVSVKFTYNILRDPQKSTTELPRVIVHVRAPEGKAAEAFKLIDNSGCALALQTFDAQNSKAVEAAATVAEKYGDTKYAASCAFLSAMGTLRGAKPDPLQAAAKFTDFLRKNEDHPKASSAIFYIALSYLNAGNESVARDWFYFLKDHDPAFHILRSENPIAYAMYYGPAEGAEGRKWWLYDKPWDAAAPQKGRAGSGAGRTMSEDAD